MRVAHVLKPDRRIACVTLDFETDYGDRLAGEFNILREEDRLAELGALFEDLEVPVSAFIRTDLFEDYPGSLELARSLASDRHCHSHTHAMTGFDSEFEIARTQEAFTEAFGAPALGYRAPLGILYENDVALLAEHGFKFSSSVFPARFPGRFDNRTLPAVPFVYDNGVVELPLAAVPGVRAIISLSFLKLFGWIFHRALFATFGLPDVVVFGSHLHDFVVCQRSLSQLPPKLRLAWSVNKSSGRRYFVRFVRLLRQKGYELVTMTRLYEHTLSLLRA